MLLEHKPVIALEVLKSDIQSGKSTALDYLGLQGYSFQYCIEEAPPFWDKHKFILILVNLISVFFRGEKRANTLELVKVIGKLFEKDYPMAVLSVEPLSQKRIF